MKVKKNRNEQDISTVFVRKEVENVSLIKKHLLFAAR